VDRAAAPSIESPDIDVSVTSADRAVARGAHKTDFDVEEDYPTPVGGMS
jgi:hypothetical protein